MPGKESGRWVSKVDTRSTTTPSSRGSWWPPIFLWRASWWSPTSRERARASWNLAVSGLDTFTYWLGNWLGDALVLVGGAVCVNFMLRGGARRVLQAVM